VLSLASTYCSFELNISNEQSIWNCTLLKHRASDLHRKMQGIMHRPTTKISLVKNAEASCFLTVSGKITWFLPGSGKIKMWPIFVYRSDVSSEASGRAGTVFILFYKFKLLYSRLLRHRRRPVRASACPSSVTASSSSSRSG
jgi:hypothetical protein